MTTLPKEIRDAVRAELARQLDEIRWEEVSISDASRLYARLVNDPKVGGALRPYMSDSKIRVWIKDGPAKEYRRGLEGVGYMAGYTRRAYPGPDALIGAVLGRTWRHDPSSLEDKPMRCIARDELGQSMHVIWGPLAHLQGMHWTASTYRARNPLEPVTLIYTRASSTPLEGADWDLAQSLAELIDADCAQATYAVVKKLPIPED